MKTRHSICILLFFSLLGAPLSSPAATVDDFIGIR
jgi:hypothetical protein